MIWVAFTVCVVISWCLTGMICRYARARNFLDVPNQRSSHTIATPHGGGIALVISFLLMILVLAYTGYIAFSDGLVFLVAGGWIAVIGLLDDIRHIPARWRLLTHFLGAASALYWLNGMPPLLIADNSFDLGWLGHIAAAIFLVWLLNLYNFMDGIDGIAGLEAVTVCFGGALMYWLYAGQASPWVVPLMLVAATFGFLCWNFPKSRIFMGDTGSSFIGFIIGLFVIQAAWYAPELIWGWLILLGAFITDATVTLIRRVKRGEKFYEAHRSHAYQYAARKFRSHVKVSIAFAAINLVWLLPVAIMAVTGLLEGVLALAIAYLPLIYLAYYFNAGARELQ